MKSHLQQKRTNKDNIIRAYSEKLDNLVKSFYTSLSSSDEANMENFKFLDLEWKKWCYKANKTHKFLNLPIHAFEKTIIRNRNIAKISESEPRLPGEYLNTLKDSELELMVTDKTSISFYIYQYERYKQDNSSKTINVG